MGHRHTVFGRRPRTGRRAGLRGLAYRRFGVAPAALAGAVSALGAFVLELFTAGNLARTLEFNLIYLSSLLVSGAVLAGVLGWIIVRALAATGVLDRFAAGREHRERTT